MSQEIHWKAAFDDARQAHPTERLNNLSRAFLAQASLIREMRESIEELYLALAVTDPGVLANYADSIQRARDRSMRAKALEDAAGWH
jgi:hypothetical protein